MNSVRIVPWTEDFIEALAALLAREARDGDLSRLRVVFPHNRPARHLRSALAARPDLPRPALLPRLLAFDDFLRGLRLDLDESPPRRAGRLDRVGLLHRVVRGLGAGGGPLARLDATAREFFPWGARLAALLDELALHGIAPRDLHHLDGAVLPWAEALLGQLGGIDAAYKAAMAEQGWSTAGLDALWLSERLDAVQERLAGERLIFAGLYALRPAEEALVRHLRERGEALVLWHTDPALALGGEVAWPAREHARQLRAWGARAELETAPSDAAEIQVRRFYEGFDLHSQLHALERELAVLPDTSSTAVVLPDPGALVPVLHHLPRTDVNISMGYPLARSGLAQLLETILALHENGDGAGRHLWRDLLAFSRHPLVRMLRVGEATPLRDAYPSWEAHIRGAGVLQSPHEWALGLDAEASGVAEEDVRELHASVLNACFTRFAGLTTLRQLGQALAHLCALLRDRGGEAWQHRLLDAECLLRLWQSVVPELTGSVLADEPFDQPLLFLILRHLLEAERVSFEPEPLAGMQVLGMLETRLLRFRRLFVLDATEDHLPGQAAPDPLLPDPLRRELGLPGARERDNVAAHNFFRLLMGAREVCVLYQAGVRPGALEGKSVRSRFVEQLLWELERRTGELVRPEPGQDVDAPLRSVTFPVSALHPSRPAIPVTPALRARLLSGLVEKGVTPSALEEWLACPKRATFRRVLRLRPMQEVAEDGDRARFGELAHEILRDFFAPHLGRAVSAASLDPRALWRRMEQALAGSDAVNALPFDSRTALAAATRERLDRFLAATPQTTVAALELRLERTIRAGGRDILLAGQADRIDLRGEGHVVLDYKTGSVTGGGATAWLDAALFERIAAAQPGTPEAAALLAELAEAGLDVQLPLYLHLLDGQEGWRPSNAAWVALKSDGAEKPLFAEDCPRQERDLVLRRRVPLLLDFLLGHLLGADEFPARPARHCDWCDYRGPCLS